jgi:hypothetical protein
MYEAGIEDVGRRKVEEIALAQDSFPGFGRSGTPQRSLIDRLVDGGEWNVAYYSGFRRSECSFREHLK